MAVLPPSLADVEAIASACGAGYGRAAGERSGASVDWLLVAVAGEGPHAEWSARRAGVPVG